MKKTRAIVGRGPRSGAHPKSNTRNNNNGPGLGSATLQIIRPAHRGHPMSSRERLSNRRASELFDIDVGGRRYRCTFSRFPDGRLAEAFISNNKAGSDSDCAARDSAVVCSIALQYGVPLETIRRALMRDSQGCPNGPLGVALDLIANSNMVRP
jgi:hypothetical protein